MKRKATAPPPKGRKTPKKGPRTPARAATSKRGNGKRVG